MQQCIVSFAAWPQGLAQASGTTGAASRLPGLQTCVAGAVPASVLAVPAAPVDEPAGSGFAAADPELRWSPPHERALAAALGLEVTDGCVPLAGLEAARAGLPADGRVWGRISPAHWHLGTEQITMHDPDELALDEASSRAFFEAARPLFEEEGFEWRWVAATLWLASHPSLQGLPCASLDRVSGRNVDLWMAADPRARLVRRLQNEVQMLWHTHPLNAEREAQGLPVVNSFWLDGCGTVPGPQVLERTASLRLENCLRRPALQGDAQAWLDALVALDAELFQPAVAAASRGAQTLITLCGERTSVQLRPQPPRGPWPSWVQAWRRRQAPLRVQRLLESL